MTDDFDVGIPAPADRGGPSPIDTIREALEHGNINKYGQVEIPEWRIKELLAALTEVEHQLAAAYDREAGTSDALDAERARAVAAEAALAEANDVIEQMKRHGCDWLVEGAKREIVAAERRANDLATTVAQQLTPLDVAVTHIQILRRKSDDYSSEERDNVAAIVEAHASEARVALFAALDAARAALDRQEQP